MAKFIPSHYFDLIEKAESFHHLQLPKAEELIRDTAIKKEALGSLEAFFIEPMFYIADYTQNKYLYMDKGLNLLFGYDLEKLMESGPKYLVSTLWHPNDCKVFNEKILPEVMQFLKKQPAYHFCNISFSFNYRMRTIKGNYLSILQRSTYYMGEDGLPLASVGFVLDITHFKEGTSMIHTIERIDSDFTNISKTPLLKSVYYPDHECSQLSKRELEILKYLAKGMSSKEMADTLHISINTVNNHRRKMLEKTGTRNSMELLAYTRHLHEELE